MGRRGAIRAIEFKEAQGLRESLTANIAHLLDGVVKRKMMSQIGHELVDGRGALQVAHAMSETLAGRLWTNEHQQGRDTLERGIL